MKVAILILRLLMTPLALTGSMVPGGTALAFSPCTVFEKDDPNYPEQSKAATELLENTANIYLECQRDDDCALASGICGNTISVHKNYKFCFDKASMIYGATINCFYLQNNTPQYPRCINGLCAVKEKK